jgi:thiamine-monophosphate kinase
MHEFEFIAWIKAQLPIADTYRDAADVVLGIGDDCALIRQGSTELLAVSTDTLVAGTHFYADTDPLAIGHKAAATNLSDLAAMAAKPIWATLAITLPDWNEALACGIVTGILQVLQPSGVKLIGGDTTRGPLSLTLTVAGSVPEELALKRSGAKIGDAIFVTGTLGDAGGGLYLRRFTRSEISPSDAQAFGLHAMRDASAEVMLLSRLDRPSARVQFALALRGIASAALDVSDGFLQDLAHICKQSGVGALVDVAALPVSTSLLACFDLPAARTLACGGGDDYELCFTAASSRKTELMQAAEACGLALSQVGLICSGTAVECWSSDGVMPSVDAKGYQHF